MKEWRKPELSLLNLSETRADGCDCGQIMLLGPDDNVHYCHRKKEVHRNNCSSWKNEVHYQSDKCDGNHWSYAHVSACCCGEHMNRGSGI